MMTTRPTQQRSAESVICVGHGRGFVVEDADRHRYIITAGHCLPRMPRCHGFSLLEERTFQKLLARLNERPSVWCECLFLDPIADIAVLGAPDDQELYEQADAYEALVATITPLTIAEPPSLECPAQLLSLDSKWLPCKVRHANGPLWIVDARGGIRGGMSGSPIIAKEGGAAIGVICLGSDTGPIGSNLRVDGPNPRLMGNLPGWFLQGLKNRRQPRKRAADKRRQRSCR
jgi:hypothetical protein